MSTYNGVQIVIVEPGTVFYDWKTGKELVVDDENALEKDSRMYVTEKNFKLMREATA